jgi:DNA-directed RNA polymerase specialized sigma24 family protein
MRDKIVKMARTIQGLNHLGWTFDDAENELLIAVIKACRAWVERSADEPEPAYLMQAVVRRRFRIWESIRKAWDRDVTQRDDFDATTETIGDNSTPESEKIEQGEQSGQEAVVYALRRQLPEHQFAILQLRALGFSTALIAESMGIKCGDGKPDHQEVSRQLYRIRQRSAEFLRQIGIQTCEDAKNVNRRSLFADDQPQHQVA